MSKSKPKTPKKSKKLKKKQFNLDTLSLNTQKAVWQLYLIDPHAELSWAILNEFWKKQ